MGLENLILGVTFSPGGIISVALLLVQSCVNTAQQVVNARFPCNTTYRTSSCHEENTILDLARKPFRSKVVRVGNLRVHATLAR